jgi:hypothetical protein
VNGSKPVVMIFARGISDPLTSLVKKVDAINKDQGKKMGSFVVVLGDDEGMEKKLKELAEKEKLEKTALTIFAKPDGPEEYDIAKDADVTVICYKSKKVKTNRAFKKGEFKAADVDKIIKEDLSKIIDSEKK